MRTSPLRRSGVDHTVLPANTPHLPLPYSSPESATTEWTVIAPADDTYILLINRPREDERLSWPCLLTYSGRTVYPYKWLPISCRYGADQWKFAGQRPTFYHWATQPTTEGREWKGDLPDQYQIATYGAEQWLTRQVYLCRWEAMTLFFATLRLKVETLTELYQWLLCVFDSFSQLITVTIQFQVHVLYLYNYTLKQHCMSARLCVSLFSSVWEWYKCTDDFIGLRRAEEVPRGEAARLCGPVRVAVCPCPPGGVPSLTGCLHAAGVERRAQTPAMHGHRLLLAASSFCSAVVCVVIAGASRVIKYRTLMQCCRPVFISCILQWLWSLWFWLV